MEIAVPNVKAVFFDLDDTLYDQLKPFRDAFHHTLPLIGLGDSAMESFFRRVRHYSDRLWDKYKAGSLRLEEVRIQRLTLAFEDFGIREDEGAAQRLQSAYESLQNDICLSDGAQELIEALQRKGVDVGIMTNGPYEHQRGKIRALGLDRMIAEERIFISDALGMAKPDPDVFRHIGRVIGQPSSKCVYIGDAWVNDIAASTTAGWHAVWLNKRGASPGEAAQQPVRTVADLREISFL